MFIRTTTLNWSRIKSTWKVIKFRSGRPKANCLYWLKDKLSLFSFRLTLMSFVLMKLFALGVFQLFMQHDSDRSEWIGFTRLHLWMHCFLQALCTTRVLLWSTRHAFHRILVHVWMILLGGNHVTAILSYSKCKEKPLGSKTRIRTRHIVSPRNVCYVVFDNQRPIIW